MGARLQVPLLRWDLGRVHPGMKVDRSIPIANPGPGTLRIVDLRPECGCLSGKAARTLLAPGEATSIEVSFDPPPEEGAVTKRLEIVTDPPAGTPVTLAFTADVRIDVQPSANLVRFEQLPGDAKGLAEILLENRRDQPLLVEDLRSSAPGYLRAEPVARGRDALIRVILDGTRIPRGFPAGRDWVEVRTANPGLSVFRIQVLWSMAPPAGDHSSILAPASAKSEFSPEVLP